MNRPFLFLVTVLAFLAATAASPPVCTADTDWLRWAANLFSGMAGNTADGVYAVPIHDLIFVVINFAVILMLIMLFRYFAGIRKRKRKAPVAAKFSFNLKGLDPTDKRSVVQFFLEIYRLQVGAAPDAPRDHMPVGSTGPGKNETYELRVKHQDIWVRRRMTIGPIGNESGSKSVCFYVIYDDHLVVKVPLFPITDWEDYIARIQREKNIAHKLAPKECLIPRVSIVLNRIPAFTAGTKLAPQEELAEDVCIKDIQIFTMFQAFLKIADTFVFFMNLSKHFFLGDIIEKIHDRKDLVAKEMEESADIIWQPYMFRKKFGSDNMAVCYGLQKVFMTYEKKLSQLSDKTGLATPLPFQIKNWFITYFAGSKITDAGREFPESFTREINFVLGKLFADNSHILKSYENLIRTYARQKAFVRNKSQIESILSNLLALLGWLRLKEIAMRDLKPENLLVAGDPAEYPSFLCARENFEIGLIDVETAVSIEIRGAKRIRQAELGGTPCYATPSHLFTNDVLSATFGDLPRILHLQDWQSTIAVMYKTVTGERLFDKSGRAFISAVSNIQQYGYGKRDSGRLVRDANRIFWPSAVGEFKEKMQQKAGMLNSVSVVIPDSMKPAFYEIALREKENVNLELRQLFEDQRVFKSEEDRQKLSQASAAYIRKLSGKWLKHRGVTSDPDKRAYTMQFFEKLQHCRYQAEKYERILTRLNQEAPEMTAYEAMGLMFNNVLRFMYKGKWEEFSADTPDMPEETAHEMVCDATI